MSEVDGLPLFAQTTPPAAAMLSNVREALATGRHYTMTAFDKAGVPLPATAPEPVSPAPVDTGDGYRTAAYEWMAAHPEAMLVFETLARRAAAARRRFGAKALAERVRWEYTVDRGDAEFKVNNNHTSWIARELVRRHPELSEFIEFRKVKEDA